MKSRILRKEDKDVVDVEQDKQEFEKDIAYGTRSFLGFCENTSVHGMKFIGQKSFHWTERAIWSILVIAAIFGIIYISLQLSQKFSTSPLSTVVESTIFPVAEIAYPAITICNKNRFSKQRVEEAEKRFIPSADNATVEAFRFLLASMNQLEFGAFDEFELKVFDFTSPELDKLNLTEIFHFVMLRCEEIFVGRCWWRNKYVECCQDFFQLQNSEYGICYSFNSAVNSVGIGKLENSSTHYPYRTSNYGDWSGLRVEMSTRRDIAMNHDIEGITIIVQHPNQWPNSGHFVPTGSSTTVVIKPTYSYTTDDVRRLSPEQRQCLNENESKHSMTLPGLKYLQMNCISECRQQHMLKYCNCSVEALFPMDNATNCNFDDLKCLYKHNDIFNYEKPPTGNPFFLDSDEGMECSCLPECNRIDYAIEVAPNIISIGDNMTVDFHFQSANMVKYRTDVTFGWLDLMVSFGGIAGLFLGCSILSGVEIIYFSVVISLKILRNLRDKTQGDSTQSNAGNPYQIRERSKNCENLRTIRVQSKAEGIESKVNVYRVNKNRF